MSNFLLDTTFTGYRDYIYKLSGIHFSESNRAILESRVKEKLRLHKIETSEDYLQKIKSDDEERKAFLDSITTNLTRFFRNTAHYKAFINYVIPDLIDYKRKIEDKTIKLWCAGCSTGEEPYTNAMVLAEYLPSDFTFEIIASDLSLKSIMKAEKGIYPASRVQDIEKKYLDKYFEKIDDDNYRIVQSLRDRVKFDYHNLKHDSIVRNLDLIFCRNVLIYFDEVAQKEVITKFWDAMTKHGYLFIGHSESLFGMETRFEFIRTEWACIYGKILSS